MSNLDVWGQLAEPKVFDKTYEGHPHRFRIDFRKECRTARTHKWFFQELIGDINNLIGGRTNSASYTHSCCYVASEKDADFVLMFFKGYIWGVFDNCTKEWHYFNGVNGPMPDC